MRFALALFSMIVLTSCSAEAQRYRLFVGTYTNGKSEGIYVFDFDAGQGTATAVDVAKGVSNPSYVALSSDGKYLYAANENGGAEATISAFSVDAKTGKLHFLNKKPSEGDAPCYVTVSEGGQWVFAANYSGGNLVGYHVEKDGSLGDRKQVIQHEGKGNTDGQTKPHVHSTIFHPDGKTLLVCDLGLDKIFAYDFNEKTNGLPLTAAKPPFASTHPGAGPRHLSFHPNKKWFYVIEEMSGFVSAWEYSKSGMKEIGRIDAHPKGYTGNRGSGDIHVSPDGQFVYASNRFQANDIAILKIDPATGQLSTVANQSLTTQKPRNFVISPDGKWMLVAGQDADFIEVFSINKETGLLTATGKRIPVPNAVSLQLKAY